MSQTQTRKRPAPGSSPVETVPFKTSSNPNNSSIRQNSAASPMAASQNFQWPQQTQTRYTDAPNDYGSSPYNGASKSHAIPMAPSSQVATRPPGQHMVSRLNHNDPSSENWPVLTDGTRQPASGTLTNRDDDLDQRAEIARNDSQAKRKQIPPFVQKLSR